MLVSKVKSNFSRWLLNFSYLPCMPSPNAEWLSSTPKSINFSMMSSTMALQVCSNYASRSFLSNSKQQLYEPYQSLTLLSGTLFKEWASNFLLLRGVHHKFNFPFILVLLPLCLCILHSNAWNRSFGDGLSIHVRYKVLYSLLGPFSVCFTFEVNRHKLARFHMWVSEESV